MAAALAAALLGGAVATVPAQAPPVAAPDGEVAVLDLRRPVADVEFPSPRWTGTSR